MILNEGCHNNSHINTINDENIGNYGYISTLILWIYPRIFWKKISINLKFNKTHGNIRKNL